MFPLAFRTSVQTCSLFTTPKTTFDRDTEESMRSASFGTNSSHYMLNEDSAIRGGSRLDELLQWMTPRSNHSSTYIEEGVAADSPCIRELLIILTVNLFLRLMLSTVSFTLEGVGRELVSITTGGSFDTIWTNEKGTKFGAPVQVDWVATKAVGRGTIPPMRILYIAKGWVVSESQVLN